MVKKPAAESQQEICTALWQLSETKRTDKQKTSKIEPITSRKHTNIISDVFITIEIGDQRVTGSAFALIHKCRDSGSSTSLGCRHTPVYPRTFAGGPKLSPHITQSWDIMSTSQVPAPACIDSASLRPSALQLGILVHRSTSAVHFARPSAYALTFTGKPQLSLCTTTSQDTTSMSQAPAPTGISSVLSQASALCIGGLVHR
jgi:hypothetical protein